MKMKKAISFLSSLRSSLKQWVGLRAQPSTLMSLGLQSSSEKFAEQTLKKLEELMEENESLKETLRLIQEDLDSEFDL